MIVGTGARRRRGGRDVGAGSKQPAASRAVPAKRGGGRKITRRLVVASAALVGYAVYMVLGGIYYLSAGLLFANAWESLRRVEERALKDTRRPVRKAVATNSARV